MLQVTIASLRTSTRRYTATALAIVLGVGFVAATLVLSATLGASVRARISDDLGRYAVVVTTSPDGPTSSIPLTALTTVAHLGGVASAEGTTRSYARVQGAAQELTSAVTWHDLRTGSPFRLVAGRGPTTPGQVAVSTSIATRAGLAVAGPVSVSGPDGTTHVLVVSGIVDTSRSGQYASGGVVFGTAPLLATWSGSTGLDEIDVVGAPGTNDTQLRDAVSAALPDVTVRTGGEEADAQVTATLKDTQTLTLFLLAFAVVALFVSTLVIANTFAILVAQRLQQLALVRCVGATRRQVFGSVLLESLAIGVIGSALGVGLGISTAAVVSAVSGRFDSPFPLQQLGIDATSIVAPFIAGTVVTVVAALFPALRATRVAPLAALRPEVPTTTRTRAGVVRIGAAAFLVLGGGAALILGARAGQLGVAIPGGMVSFVGILLGAVVLVPALVRVAGVLPRRLAGVPADLAVENAVRNPGRAAATTSALLVGVTLITMMSVAAMSAQGAITDYLSARYPVDAQITADGTGLTSAVVESISRTAGVSRVITLTSSRLSLAGGDPDTVTGIPTDTVGDVLRSRAATSIAQVKPGTVVVADWVAADRHLVEGSRTTLGRTTVTVHVMKEPFAAVMAADRDVAHAGGAASTGTVSTGTVLVRLTDASDPGPTMDRLAATLRNVPGVVVDGAAPQRVEFQRIVDVVLLIVTGLLAVAVLIALVGVGNTLSLSVLERGRESALVRALGLTRGQLRASLSIEAGLLALVGAVAGILLGIGYGYAGARALLGQIAPVPLVIPWDRLAIVAAIALAAGVAAAWLPSRRAARIAPATALALE